MTRVWSLPVRLLHWSLVCTVAAGWLTRAGYADDRHIWIGYACAGVIAVRLLLGFLGTRPDRFASFITSPGKALAYARLVHNHREPRYLTHNPLGAWMIVALLVVASVVCFSGWLYTTDDYWGIDWVIQLHDIATTTLLCLATLHVGGVIFTSWRHRENLVAAMVHGRKRDPGPGDVSLD